MIDRPSISESVPFRVAVIYAIASLLWILFSDNIVDAISVDRTTLTELQTLKGWFFVLCSALLIFLLVRFHFRRSAIATQELLRREQRHSDLFRNAPMAIWETDLSQVRRHLDLILRGSVADPNMTLQSNPQLLAKIMSLSHILEANQAAVQIVGAQSAEEAMRFAPQCLIGAADGPIREALVQLYKGAPSVEVEARLRTLQGELRFVLLRVSIASDVAESWERAVVSMVDITERRVMEERLQDRERMLSEAQRIGNTGAFEWDLVTDRLIWSDETHRIHGTDPLHFTPRYDMLQDMFHVDDRSRVVREFRDLLTRRQSSRGGSVKFEYRIRRPDGHVRSIESHLEVVRDSDGIPVRMFGMVRDITEQKELARFLERHNTNLQRLVVVIQQLSFTHDMNSLAHLVSTAAQLLVSADSTVFALREDDKVRCVAEQAAVPFFRDMVIPLTMGVSGWTITNRQAVAIDDISVDSRISKELYKNSGICSQIMVPIRQEDPVGAVGAFWNTPHSATPDEIALLQALADAAAVALSNIHSYQDLDAARREAERKSEENLRLYEEAHREMSERKEAERRRGELEAQLRQSQKMEVIGILAGGIAHDFNNILTPLCGYAEMALESLPSDAEGREELEHIMSAANRAKGLIQQILTFSRRSEQVREAVSLHSIVKEATNLLRASLPPSIDIRFESAATSMAVKADPVQIHQVVMNLCTNAYHALREKGGLLELTLMPATPAMVADNPRLQDLPCLRLQVRDTGCGMEPSVLAHVFEPFFTTKEKGEGTGLGLAVVQSIITAHGGEISVESRPGAGTTFTIFLPRAEVLSNQNSPLSRRLPSGNGERILLVDDEVAIVTMLRKIFTRLGYEVLSFSDSVVALDGFRLSPHLFDLVILDWNMPQVSGRDLATAVHKIRPEIPILLMTGLRHELKAEELSSAGISECVRKPFTPFEISTAAHNLLRKRQSQPTDTVFD